MTKRNQMNRLTNPRNLDAAELATATGGYTLTLSYDLSRTSAFYSSIANLSKPASEVTSTDTDNLK